MTAHDLREPIYIHCCSLKKAVTCIFHVSESGSYQENGRRKRFLLRNKKDFPKKLLGATERQNEQAFHQYQAIHGHVKLFCSGVLRGNGERGKENFLSIKVTSRSSFILKLLVGLPWRRSGKERARQCRGCRFDPWSRKMPRATE